MISPKVTAVTIAAAVVTVLVWVASMVGVSVPPEVQGAVTTIIVALVGYLVPDPSRVTG